MRLIFIIAWMLFSSIGLSQLKFPKDFKLVKGENGAGMDDYYTNGRYGFSTTNLFADHEFKINDDSVKAFISSAFGFPFKTTKDGFYWGTGFQNGIYEYVIVAPPYGEDYELYSKYNDQGFSRYSIWLLSTIREYKRKGKNYS